MPIARDDWGYRDPGLPGYMQIKELSPAERKAAEEAKAKRDAETMKGFIKSNRQRKENERGAEVAFGAAVDEASVVLTPRQAHLKRLQYVEQPDGSRSLLHASMEASSRSE